jgi:hypothetical protein
MREQVSFLVADTALYRHLAEDGADRLPERLGAVGHEQDRLLGVEAALDQIGAQRGGDGCVLRRSLPQPDRELDAVGADPEADDVRAPL